MATTALAQRQQTTRQQQYQPRNADEQADANATRLLARLQNYNFGLSNDLAATLQSNGIPTESLPMIVSTCVAAGVSPALLAYRHNIPAIVRVMGQVVDLGYRAGEDFYVAVFNSKTKVMNEYGEPTKETVEAPTVVVMPSAARAVENMRNEDRLNGNVYHHFENGALEGDEARKVFNQQIGTSAPWGDGVVVAYVDMYTYLNGKAIGSGKPTRFYGLFLPWRFYNNEIKADYTERDRVKDNYTPFDIACKRAMVKAARSVTRTNYPRDNRPADVRRAALAESALSKLSDIESDARKQGISVEAAFESGIIGDEPTPTPSMMPSEKPVNKEANGDILFGYDDGKPKHRRPQDQPEPIIPDPVIPTGDEEGSVIDGAWEFTSLAPTDILTSNLPQPVIDWVASIRRKFVGGCKTVTPKQDEYARKCVELVTGQGTFDEVYTTLAPVGYEGEDMPLAVADIFFTLPQKRRTQKPESGKWETVENDKYNPENVEFLDIVAKWIVQQNEIDM